MITTNTIETISLLTSYNENHCIKGGLSFLLICNTWFLTSLHCFPISFCSNCTYRFLSKVVYAWQSIMAPVTRTPINPLSLFEFCWGERFSSENDNHSDDELKYAWLKSDVKMKDGLFLETTRLTVVIDNSDRVSEVGSAVIDDEIIKRFAN